MLILATVNWQICESKLFKLDRLGGVLWEHTISDEEEGLVTIKMIDDEEGNIFLAGMTCKYDVWGDAFLMKLDACGNLIWFQEYGWQDGMD
tara:strand:- start:585 stop:857 length:273 start_codon:yes stop_codon:yes gene_type:complete